MTWPIDDHFGAGVAVLGQPVELREDLVARQAAFDDDEVRRRVLLIVRDGRLDAAHVHADMRLGQPAILGGDLHDLAAAPFSQNAWMEMRGMGRARGRAGWLCRRSRSAAERHVRQFFRLMVAAWLG